MNNYPDGIENDPNAPWNEKDVEMTEWVQWGPSKNECVCCSEIDYTDEDRTCENCFLPKEVEDFEDYRDFGDDL